MIPFIRGGGDIESLDISNLDKLKNEYIVTSNDSDIGLTYLCVTPKKAVLKDIKILTIAVFIFILSALIISFIMCFRNSRIVLNFFNKTSKLTIRTNIFQVLNRTFSDTISDNKSLKDSYNIAARILQKEVFNKVLNSEFYNLIDLKAYADNIKIDFKNRYYIFALSIDLDKDTILNEDLDRLKVLSNRIYSSLEDIINKDGYIIKCGIDRLIILIDSNLANCNPVYFQDLFSKIQYMDDLDILLSSCSNFQTYSILQLSEEAYNYIRTLNLKKQYYNKAKGSLNMVTEIRTDKPKKDYHISVERLNNFLISIKKGDFNIAKDIMSKEYYDVVYYNDIHNNLRKNFISQIKSVLEIGIPQTSLYANYLHEAVDNLNMGRTLYLYLIGIINEVCRLQKEITKSICIDRNTDQDLKLKIKEYIYNNMSNSSLSLKSIADEFGFSPSYFSTIFKECMNINFSSYVEQLRMEYAKELILSKKYKIEEIAFKCGYSNTDSFRRTYKRFYGMSPSKTF